MASTAAVKAHLAANEETKGALAARLEEQLNVDQARYAAEHAARPAELRPSARPVCVFVVRQ